MNVRPMKVSLRRRAAETPTRIWRPTEPIPVDRPELDGAPELPVPEHGGEVSEADEGLDREVGMLVVEAQPARIHHRVQDEAEHQQHRREDEEIPPGRLRQAARPVRAGAPADRNGENLAGKDGSHVDYSGVGKVTVTRERAGSGAGGSEEPRARARALAPGQLRPAPSSREPAREAPPGPGREETAERGGRSHANPPARLPPACLPANPRYHFL